MKDPIVTTQRLSLTPISSSDAPFILRLLNEPSFINNIGDRGVRDVAAAEKYIIEKFEGSYQAHGFGLYKVTEVQTGHDAGICGLVKRDSLPDVDIGFAFLPEFWGKGYAEESARAIRDQAQSKFNLNRLLGITSPENHASVKVLLKIGMKETGSLLMPGENRPVRVFAMNFSGAAIE